jgi:uncharacterized membrane protein YqaE (UPF0057 family)
MIIMEESKSINIKIDLDSFQRGLNLLAERLQHLSGSDVAFMILALIMPPIAVLLKVGLTVHFWVNLILTILGVLPGQIHALWVVLFM